MWKKHKTVLICLSFVLLFSGLVNASAGEISMNDAIHLALQESLEFKIDIAGMGECQARLPKGFSR